MVDWEAFYSSFRKPGFIPGYEIQNHLGGGAFGEVYKARKTSIGKSYAIKFLKLDEASNRDAIERELEQVRLFASIDHPNLVTIEDMGVTLEVPYLIMGYAGDDTLARRLKRGDMDAKSALRYFVQASRGVLALHDRRLAHFDLKPGNIFIRGDAARVGDYGLAKLLTEGRQTLSFGRGTPHYMAPEMLRNRADHRADVYSLGVILFESLALRLPYDSQILRDKDAVPDYPEDFPEELRPAVEKCLRIDPEERFQSVRDLLTELGQHPGHADSVRIRPRLTTPEPAERESEPMAEEAVATSVSGDDLKQAAAELARGAVGVARGVWDGVRERVSANRREAEEADADGPSVEAEPAPAGDIVSVSTLDESDEPDPSAVATLAAAGMHESAWQSELRRGRGEPELPVPLGAPSASVVSTVPVPPRAEGGLVGNVFQSVVLGGEILGALVTGPVMVGLRGTANVFDRIVRGVPGVLGGLIRLVMLVVLMMLLGGLVAFLILFGISFAP